MYRKNGYGWPEKLKKGAKVVKKKESKYFLFNITSLQMLKLHKKIILLYLTRSDLANIIAINMLNPVTPK